MVKSRGGRCSRGRGKDASSSGGGESSTPLINAVEEEKCKLRIKCRPQLMVCFYKEHLSKKISAAQKQKLSETPFAHLLEMPEYIVSTSLFEYIFNQFNSDSLQFNIAGVTVPFTPRDVALIMGLMEHGNVLQLYGPQHRRINTGDKSCRLHKEYFAGQYEVKYSQLQDILVGLAGKEEKTDDFVSLLMLYVFSMLLFPLPSGSVNMKMLPFAQDLEKISSYSWAMAVHQSIIFNLTEARSKGTVNIGVCSFALNIWFLERCSIFEGRVMIGGVPRYYNWSMRQRMSESAVKEMFRTLFPHMICTEKDLPFINENEPMILTAGCNLGLLNKCYVDVKNKKRKKPEWNQQVAQPFRKRKAVRKISSCAADKEKDLILCKR